MAAPREGPNPLRPYYIPPSIGISPGSAGPTSNAPNALPRNGTTSSYATSARDMFSDMDYSNYVSEESQSTLDTIKEVLDQAMYKYMHVMLAQPFEVAKTVLQVRSQALGNGILPLVDMEDGRDGAASFKDPAYADYPSDDSDPDEPAYFTSNAPSSTSYSPSRSRRRDITDRAGYVLSSPGSSLPHQLSLNRTDSIMEVVSQLWSKEGSWGVWKGANATFVYNMLLKAVESWSRSFLSAVANVPDPGLITGLGPAAEMIDSAYPWTSLGVAIAAAAMAGVILAPLDIVRTKLMLTSTTTNKKRGILHDFKLLPSWFCPSRLYIPTILHSITSPLFTHGTPIFLRTQLGIDQVLTPTTFSVSTFLSSSVELFVKLPIETVLRRGQMSVLASPTHVQAAKTLDTIVDVGAYRGTIGTMWLIVREEGGSGETAVRGVKTSKKLSGSNGQGVQGLWRGWRVGMWGLVGMWGAAAMGGVGGSGGEF